jgi:penicillin V acylase-like amidase (Ntn superfamily)
LRIKRNRFPKAHEGDNQKDRKGKEMMNQIVKAAMAVILSIVFLCSGSAHACTYFFLKAKDGALISGRTDEFYSDTDSKIDLAPRGIAFRSTAPANAKALSWKTKCGFVAVSMFNKDMYGDGMNEKGLAAGGLYFEDAKYPAVKPGEEVIRMDDVVGWKEP